jgi:hypothetical protein
LIWIKVAGTLVTHSFVAALRYDIAPGDNVALIALKSLPWIAAGNELRPHHRRLKETRLYELRAPSSAKPLCISATQRTRMIEK